MSTVGLSAERSACLKPTRGGLHAKLTRRGALSIVIEALQKRTSKVPKQGRNVSLKLEVEEIPKEEKERVERDARRQKASRH